MILLERREELAERIYTSIYCGCWYDKSSIRSIAGLNPNEADSGIKKLMESGLMRKHRNGAVFQYRKVAV